jgi:hypothetical protein
MQAAEAGTDDHHLSGVLTTKRWPSGQAIGTTVGVIAGDMLLELLKHSAPHEIYFL